MRELSCEGLVALGDAGRGPWRLPGNLLLRTERVGAPLRDRREAQGVLDAYAAARDAGVGAPEPIEVVRVGGGYGVIVGYVAGVNMGVHILLGSYDVEEAGREIGLLARRLHACRATAGRDLNALFRSWARTFAAFLPQEEGRRLVGLVDAVPRSGAFLHGDLHPGNVVVRAGRPSVIDLELAGFGHPVFELAIMRSRALFGIPRAAGRYGIAQDVGREVAGAFWQAVLSAYLGDGGRDLDALDRSLAILSEIENCCFGHEVRDGDPSLLTSAQRRRMDVAVARVHGLLEKTSVIPWPGLASRSVTQLPA